MKLTWYPAGADDPLDEQADIMGGYWGLIGPDGEGRFNWTVVAPDGKDAAGGRAETADAAKAAVSRWDTQMVDYSTGRRSIPPDGRESAELQFTGPDGIATAEDYARYAAAAMNAGTADDTEFIADGATVTAYVHGLAHMSAAFELVRTGEQS